MIEKAPTPYPERTEDVIVLVCEPATEYGKTIGYQGTTITNALKDYYAFTTNREKVEVLKWIVAQPDFAELQRFSTVENKIFTLYANQYNEILKKGELPSNLQIAQKFVTNGYDVFLLSNPRTTKSADFIVRKRNSLFYIEGKTSSGGKALETRLKEGLKQSNRIAINFVDIPNTNYLIEIVKNLFFCNTNILELILFKGHRMITVTGKDCRAKKFERTFKKIWNQAK
ncbi:MAG: hypothetical protein J6Y55_07135 [Bacteroidales bacterium]|nr:hypothetical protein [Bacteroidales bacterium]